MKTAIAPSTTNLADQLHPKFQGVLDEIYPAAQLTLESVILDEVANILSVQIEIGDVRGLIPLNEATAERISNGIVKKLSDSFLEVTQNRQDLEWFNYTIKFHLQNRASLTINSDIVTREVSEAA